MTGRFHIRPRRSWPRLAAFAGVLVLAWSVLAAHGSLAGGHMGDSMGKAMAICLAVVEGAVVVAGVRRVRRRRTTRPTVRHLLTRMIALPQPIAPAPVLASARAGPERLQVFRL